MVSALINGRVFDGEVLHEGKAIAAKRKGYAVLVTDAMASVGSDVKKFTFDGDKIEAVDGSCRMQSGELAGSDLDMITAVRNAVRFAGIDTLEALRLASSYPAAALGLESQRGFIRRGYKASFIKLDDEQKIREAGGIDLQLMGIGYNGHYDWTYLQNEALKDRFSGK
jgi:N-acetylglucosamine-6-phosphate deacetylase